MCHPCKQLREGSLSIRRNSLGDEDSTILYEERQGTGRWEPETPLLSQHREDAVDSVER